MPLQILFGDDEHTAKDGPYYRVLKTRKWVYIASAAALIFAHGLFSEAGAKDLLKAVAIPSWMLQQLAFGTLTYLLVQYAFLSWQLGVTYDIIVRERLAFRREEELSNARNRLEEARRALKSYRDERPQPDSVGLGDAQSRFDEALAKASSLEEQAGPNAPMSPSDLPTSELLKAVSEGSPIMSLFAARRELDSARAWLEAEQLEYDQREAALQQPDPARTSLEDSVARAIRTLNNLSNEDPARRLGYKKVEYCIDLLRVGIPAIVGALCWALLARALVG